MTNSIENMRIRFYGVQGSGSTFPATNEIRDMQAVMDCRLLEAVFKDIFTSLADRKITDRTLEQYLGGPINRKTLLSYRQKFAERQIRVYGGWTTCVHVETAEGDDIVFDCGSGFRNCAKDLQNKWGKKTEKILIYIRQSLPL